MLAEFRVKNFLQQAVRGEASLSPSILEEFARDCREALEKQFNRDPQWRIRMSGLGRPLCQQICGRDGLEEEMSYNAILRFLIFFRAEIKDSRHPAIHPISSPPGQHDWQPNLNDPKPVHKFLFPVFRNTGAIVLIGSKTINDDILRFLHSCTIVFDSDGLLACGDAPNFNHSKRY